MRSAEFRAGAETGAVEIAGNRLRGAGTASAARGAHRIRHRRSALCRWRSGRTSVTTGRCSSTPDPQPP